MLSEKVIKQTYNNHYSDLMGFKKTLSEMALKKSEIISTPVDKYTECEKSQDRYSVFRSLNNQIDIVKHNAFTELRICSILANILEIKFDETLI